MEMAIGNDYRKEIVDILMEAIDKTDLNLNEYIFASADLLRTTFWLSHTAEKSEEEIEEIKARIINSVDEIVSGLKNNTKTVAEDMIILNSIILEIVNHVMDLEFQEQEGQGSTEEPDGDE
jgi:hypothetical protein